MITDHEQYCLLYFFIIWLNTVIDEAKGQHVTGDDRRAKIMHQIYQAVVWVNKNYISNYIYIF